MKRTLSVLFALSLAGAASAADDLVRATFRETDALFANPGTGWMSKSRGSPEPKKRSPRHTARKALTTSSKAVILVR